MKIGILGTGEVGKTLANAFLATGHQVMMGSRDAANEKALAWAKAAGDEDPLLVDRHFRGHGEVRRRSAVLAELWGRSFRECADAQGTANLAKQAV